MSWLKKITIHCLIIGILLPVNVLSVMPIASAKVSAAKRTPFIIKTKKLTNSKDVELVDKRTVFSNTYLKPNGKKRLETSAEPINYLTMQNGKQKYNKIDSSLVPKTASYSMDTKSYTNKANVFNLNITDDVMATGVSISKSSANINIKPRPIFGTGKRNTINVANLFSNIVSTSGKTTIYKDKATIYDDGSAIEYTYKSTNSGLKEEIKINQPVGTNIFNFDLNLSGLVYTKQNGIYYFYKPGEKKPQFFIPPSFAYDQNYKFTQPSDSITNNVQNDIVKIGNKLTIRVTVDNAWLTSKSRKYPIIIDPTVEGVIDDGYFNDTFVQEGYPTTLAWDQTYLYTGYAGFWLSGRYYNKKRTRALMPFNAPYSLGSHVSIDYARVNLYQRINVGNHGILARMTSDYNGRDATWNNQPAYSAETAYNQNGCQECWMDFNVTNLAKYWYESNVTNFRHGYLGFWDDTDGDGTTDVHYRQWLGSGSGTLPRLIIDYTDFNAEYNYSGIRNAMVYDPYSMSVNVHNLGSNWLYSWNSKVDFEIYKNGQPYTRFERNLPNDVGPGGWTTVTLDGIAFNEPGTYTVYTDLYNDNYGWYSLYGIGQASASFVISEYPEYGANYNISNVPTSLVAGSTLNLPSNVQNYSRQTWPANSVKVGYHWLNNSTGDYAVFDGQQTSFTGDVAARGAWGTVNLQVKVPNASGSYKLIIDLIQSGTWFASKGVATRSYDINLTLPSLSSTSRFGDEDYYPKAGPVDLATGNLSFSSTDLSVASNTGLLSIERSYNSNTPNESFDHDTAGFIKNWLITGPYKENDQAIRLTQKYLNEETIRPNTMSTTNNKLWLRISNSSSTIDLNEAFDKNNIVQSGYATNSVAYLNTYVYSPLAQTAQLKLGSNNGLKVWLNGVVVLTNDVYRKLTIDSDIVTINLKAGWNPLLVKSTQSTGSWNLCARFTDAAGKPIPGLKYAYDNQAIYGDYQLLGKGWTTNFNEKIFPEDENSIYYRDATGSINQFNKISDSIYSKPVGTALSLVKNPSGLYSIVSKSGLKINFDQQGRLASKVDLSGNTISYQYDANGNCVKIIDGSRYITLTYLGSTLAFVTNSLGHKVTYTVDTANFPSKLTKVTDPIGNSISYSYNGQGKLGQFIDKNGNKSVIGYTDEGKVWFLEDATLHATRFIYQVGKTEIYNALDKKQVAEFDGNNLLTAFTNAKGYREFYQYDGDYNLIAIYPDIPENESYYFHYAYTYDAQSNLISATDPMGAKTTYEYSKDGDLTKNINSDNTTEEYTYSNDGKRLLLSEKDAKKNTVTYKYDTRGRLISMTDPEGNITQSGYSNSGDLLSTTTPKGETTTYTYDLIGRKLTEKSPLGKTILYAYSPLSQLAKVTNSAGLSTSFEYDKSGNLIKLTDSNNASTKYGYDVLNQLTTITDPSGAIITYAYDTLGNLIKVKDANGKATNYAYDELNQPVSQADPSGGTSTIEYNKNNQPEIIKDALNQVSMQEYNKSGDVAKITDNDGITAIKYDNEGKISSIDSTVNSENLSFTYDANHNPISLTSNTLGNIAAVYNKNDAATSIQTPIAKINLAYNANSQVQTVNSTFNSQTLSVNFTRDAEGKITAVTKPNGDVTSFVYDISGRVSSVTNRNRNKIMLSKFSYRYDKSSNITGIYEDRSQTLSTYAYDIRNQLTKENSTTYTYDPMGNRLTSTIGTAATKYQYDTAGDANRLLKVTYPTGRTIQYLYDANGNVIKQIDSLQGTTVYTYDSDGYFTQALLPNQNTIVYTYDKILKLRTSRIEKDSSGHIINEIKFIYDGDRLVSETDGNNKISRYYTWDQNERLFSVSIPDATGALQTFTYVKNLKEDIVGLSDAAGNLVAQYQYDAWGNITKSTTMAGSSIANLDKLNSRLYSSYWYDSSLGLYFMKTRMYNPSIGRFLSKDQAGSSGAALASNPYLYCYNNPINHIDPNGKNAIALGLVGFGGAGIGEFFAGVGIALGVVAVSALAIGTAVLFWPTHLTSSDVATDSSVSATEGSISGSSGQAFPPPPGNDNHQNKKKRNTSRNYQSNPKPEPPHIDRIESANIQNTRVTSVKDIKGFTNHGLDRLVERSNYLTPEHFIETIKNPESYIKGIDKYGRPFEKYSKPIINKLGKPDVMNIIRNPITGKIVSLY